MLTFIVITSCNLVQTGGERRGNKTKENVFFTWFKYNNLKRSFLISGRIIIKLDLSVFNYTTLKITFRFIHYPHLHGKKTRSFCFFPAIKNQINPILEMSWRKYTYTGRFAFLLRRCW